jgi:tetratricopeptide (TPR) repeat protein
MQIKDIFSDKNSAKIFNITSSDSDKIIDWTIEPTDLELIPDEEGYFIVAAKQVYADKTVDCFIDMTTTERITDHVFRLVDGKIICESFYDYSRNNQNSIIPAIASDCFGIYELYYAKENPQVGIEILRDGLTKSLTKNVIAEELGYILRDENRNIEAIEAFLISEQNEPSSEHIYLELSQLYGQLGQADKQLEYEKRYRDNGGI